MSGTRQSQFGALGSLLEGGFSIIPNVLLRDRSFSGHAKLVWAFIYDYNHQKKDGVQMTDLQADLGVGEKPVRAALRQLEEAGYIIRRRHGQGRPNSYLIAIPETLIRPQGGSRTAPGADLSSLVEDLEQDEDVGAKAPTSPGGKLERRRNIVYDAIVEATHANPADGGMIGKAIKSIRTAMADHLRELTEAYMAQNPQEDGVPSDVVDELVAGQIRIRADLYRRLRPDWELTPTALAKHWNRIPTWQARGGLSPSEAARLDLDDG